MKTQLFRFRCGAKAKISAGKVFVKLVGDEEWVQIRLEPNQRWSDAALELMSVYNQYGGYWVESIQPFQYVSCRNRRREIEAFAGALMLLSARKGRIDTVDTSFERKLVC